MRSRRSTELTSAESISSLYRGGVSLAFTCARMVEPGGVPTGPEDLTWKTVCSQNPGKEDAKHVFPDVHSRFIWLGSETQQTLECQRRRRQAADVSIR